ncbi:hypothetical protein Pcinc_015799 [Petrolisthes cinctipes]|uniref:J domain-containing protein n=1 Tax=Petrolisthes cinctipes TaxID=88211 RepID=A0AAE1KRS7_PETCI|nr:hypothetical protein Pcinc_015799 [Petrolisthes cinctipes]
MVVHDGNKDEAEKCFNLAQKYFQEGNRDKAGRFAQKAERLYPSHKSREFLELLNRLSGTTGSTTHSNGTAGGEGEGGGGRGGGPGGGEGVRQRRTSATSEERSTGGTQAQGSSSEYTREQVDAVKKILRCKDYYEILGISKDATDSDLKKAYRKLALQFHPDKNKAPGASEAFKAVGNAFAVLSDAEKKKQYDLYGPEETSAPSHHRNSYSHHDFTRGYESDMTAEELFNMFFGGGYPGGNVYVRRGGRWEHHGASRGYARGHQHNHQAGHAEQSNLSVFLQLMPLLLILLLSLASSLLSSDPTYSLSPTSKYSVQRSTSNLGVSYYVKQDFATDYQGSIRRLEQHVEEDYVSTLRNACFKEKNYKENMIWRARSFGDAQMFKRAQELRTPSCDSLQSLYS